MPRHSEMRVELHRRLWTPPLGVRGASADLELVLEIGALREREVRWRSHAVRRGPQEMGETPGKRRRLRRKNTLVWELVNIFSR